ncbi:transcriptional regulator [Paenarthrobacter histidinolovorans]|nr:transcriptional regulator [Paenarthrobacter histidinolovorans]
MQPGELYSVYKLAEDLGISRSPVREALLRLAETGMVKIERNRGFRVVLPSPRDIAEIFSIRLALEVPAARRAANHSEPAPRSKVRQQYKSLELAAESQDIAAFEQHDQQLHALLIAGQGGHRTVRLVNSLRDSTRMLGVSTMGQERTLEEISLEHLPIVEAFEAGDGEAAAASMKEHLTATGRLLIQKALKATGSGDSVDQIWSEFAD